MRLHLAALVITAPVDTPSGHFEPGDEAALGPTLTRAQALQLVSLGVITPAVLGDPDPATRVAFEALAAEDPAALDALVAANNVEPVASGVDGLPTAADKIDALLDAEVPVPAPE